MSPAQPRLSVVIPTYSRALLLRQALQSLTLQTLPSDQFEVIVIDDGSPDDTRDACRAFDGDLPLRYFRIDHSGVCAAKNLGVFMAHAPIIFFFDDDDLATSGLLAEHLATHDEYADENVAVLGYSTWAADVKVSPLMYFVTHIGRQMFAYDGLADGATLDFTYFWGGRSSCKRSLLAQWGIFDSRFQGALHDIELGYRLSRFGLQVVFNRRAVSCMNRPISLNSFCNWVERRGRALYVISQIHSGPAIDQYCHIEEATAGWRRARWLYRAQTQRARAIEAHLTRESPAVNDDLRPELWLLYQSCFDALTAKGIVDAAADCALQLGA